MTGVEVALFIATQVLGAMTLTAVVLGNAAASRAHMQFAALLTAMVRGATSQSQQPPATWGKK
jgi:hypothetical protein